MFIVAATAQKGDGFFFGLSCKLTYFITVLFCEPAIFSGELLPGYSAFFPPFNQVGRCAEVFLPDIDFVLRNTSRPKSHYQNPQAVIFALRDIGVRLAIDQFGAGLSNLRDLRQFPIDVLKIDRSFVADLDTSEDARNICSAILAVAHNLSLHAVATGIETEQQETFLSRQDCLYGQGDYLSPPAEPDRIRAMLVESGGQATRQRRAKRRRIVMN